MYGPTRLIQEINGDTIGRRDLLESLTSGRIEREKHNRVGQHTNKRQGEGIGAIWDAGQSSRDGCMYVVLGLLVAQIKASGLGPSWTS